MSTPSPDPQARDLSCSNMSSGQSPPDCDNGKTSPNRHADLSAWLIWAVLVLIAIAILPFAVRNQEVVRAIARMCGFELE